MTVLEDVAALVSKLKPDAICDDCITDKLGLSVRQHANQKTRELGQTTLYDRKRGICVFCKTLKLTIRRV